MKNTKSALCMFLASAGMALVLGGCNNDAADFSGTEGENFIAKNVSEGEQPNQKDDVYKPANMESDSKDTKNMDQTEVDPSVEGAIKTPSRDIVKKSVTPTPTPMPVPTEETEPEQDAEERDDNRGCIGDEGLVW